MRWCIVLAACGGAVAPKPPAVPKPWTDPGGLYHIEVLAPPSQRPQQAVTPFGTVDYQSFEFAEAPAVYRMAAFSYPILDAKTARFDAATELAHATAELVAQLQATAVHEQAVTVDHQPGMIGEDIELAITDGHGILRVLINPLPSAMRFAASCVVPATTSLAPCEHFVRTLVPHVPVADGPGTGPPKRPVVL